MANKERILIRSGRIIDPVQNRDFEGDLLIEGGKIAAVDQPRRIPKSKADIVIDASGCWVTPGLIDPHVHLREPGFEYKETIETGTRAAVAGGFTSVACMANTQPVNDSPYTTAYIMEKAKSTALCRVFPIGAISKGLKGEELAEIGGMVSEGARGISDDGKPVMNSYLMRKAMDYAKAFDVPVISHSEDANLVGQGAINESALSNELGLRGSPAAAEEIMVARDIALCRLTGARVHIAHISTAAALAHLARAKEEGLPITAEVTPHHLILTEQAMRAYDTNFKVSPPLRSEKDVMALRKALADGVVDMIASDHAPHGTIEKALEFDLAATGILGLQTAVPLTLQLVHESVLSVVRWVEAFTTRPAKMLGLSGGSLVPGCAADVTVLDPDKLWTFTQDQIVSKSRNSPFIEWKLRGQIVATIVGGIVKYQVLKTQSSKKLKKRRS